MTLTELSKEAIDKRVKNFAHGNKRIKKGSSYYTYHQGAMDFAKEVKEVLEKHRKFT